MGCNHRQAPRRSKGHDRKLRQDWTLAFCSARGLVRWAPFSSPQRNFKASRRIDGSRIGRKSSVTDVSQYDMGLLMGGER
jgi:hypothetical protein